MGNYTLWIRSILMIGAIINIVYYKEKLIGCMKNVVYFLFFGMYFSIIVQSSDFVSKTTNFTKYKSIDTLFILTLENKKYKNTDYKILLIKNNDENGFCIDSTRRVELSKDSKKIVKINLPNPNEVKNFSISKIEETKKGFLFSINWGGGNYIYDVYFYFIFKENDFYLYKIERFNYGPNRDGIKKIDNVKPIIPIKEFGIMKYIENE